MPPQAASFLCHACHALPVERRMLRNGCRHADDCDVRIGQARGVRSGSNGPEVDKLLEVAVGNVTDVAPIGQLIPLPVARASTPTIGLTHGHGEAQVSPGWRPERGVLAHLRHLWPET